MQNDPTITIADLAQIVGITDRAIKKQIEKMRVIGRIRRIGPDKGGHWEVSE
jgi:ATP-dependent DNA helicase RecG